MKKHNKIIRMLMVALLAAPLLLAGFDVKADTQEEAFTKEVIAEDILSIEGEDTKVLNDNSPGELEYSAEITPFAAAQPVTKYNITAVYGSGADGKPVSETFPESPQNLTDYYTARAQQAYSANDALTFTIRQQGTQATYKIISPECKVTRGDTYNLGLGSDGGVSAFTQDYLITDISPETKELKIQCILMSSYSSGGNFREFDRNIIIPILNQRSIEPTSPEIIFDAQYPDSYVLTGTDSTMEYTSFQSPYSGVFNYTSSYEWMECQEEDMLLNPDTAEIYYLIRYKATEGSEASNYKELRLPKRNASPTLTLNTQKEFITGLTTAMEYCLGEEEYLPVTEEFVQSGISDILDKIREDSVNIKIRFRADGKPVSFVKNFILQKRLETPLHITLDPITFDVSGLENGMEYQTDTMETWTSITKTILNMGKHNLSERDVSVKIRYKATSTASNSKTVIVTLPQLKNAPSGLTIDYTAETITGFDSSCIYQVSTTAAGTYGNISLSNGVWNIKNNILTTEDKELFIRKAATSENPFSAPTKIIIPKRKFTPVSNIKFVYNDPSTDDSQALLTNVNEQIEYRLNTSSTWITCSGETVIVNLPAANMYYYFRNKATDSDFITSEGKVQIYAPGSSNSQINVSSETLHFLFTALEYKINQGEYHPVGEMSKMDLAEIADSLLPGDTYTITVRRMRNETTPVTQSSTITVYPRPEPPKDLKYDSSTYILSGVSNKMDYREVGTDKWISIGGTATQLTYKTFLSTRPYNVQLEYRYRAYGGIFASYSTIVNLYD